MRGGVLRKHVRTGEVLRTATEANIENRSQSAGKIVFFLLDFGSKSVPGNSSLL
jgi:hypothetical protein